jgi:hypothetical protein
MCFHILVYFSSHLGMILCNCICLGIILQSEIQCLGLSHAGTEWCDSASETITFHTRATNVVVQHNLILFMTRQFVGGHGYKTHDRMGMSNRWDLSSSLCILETMLHTVVAPILCYH